MNWYIVQCRHSAEASTAAALRMVLRVEVYLPEVPRARRGRTTHTAFFPGYMFVHMNIHTIAPSRLMSIPGVIRLLAFDNQPQAVPDELVDEVRERVKTWKQPEQPTNDRLKACDSAKMLDGPFAGLEAVFLRSTKASDRVNVLIEFLGRQRQVEVERTMLAPDLGPSRQLGRRTRGRMRRL